MSEAPDSGEAGADARGAFRSFARREIAPHAAKMDETERVEPGLIAALAAEGHLGVAVPKSWGGAGLNMSTIGILHEEVGRACSSIRSLLTVHGMVTHTLAKWGTEAQRQAWLPSLATGERLAAFALTEPEAGSDAGAIATRAVPVPGGFALTGAKRWITFGQLADVLLVFAQCPDGPSAFLVETASEGVRATPVTGLLGARGSMVADIDLEGCFVGPAAQVGRAGFGISHVASTALAFGRFSVACGCVGIGQAALDASAARALARRQFGAPIGDHQLVRRLVSQMFANVRAARLVTADAARRKDSGVLGWVESTFVAKYFAAEVAVRSASDAVQIHGAHGCSRESPVARLLRDATVMTIIEGTTQIQEITIANFAFGAAGESA